MVLSNGAVFFCFSVMDKISGLPDELLVKIITLVPTKVAVSTSILSKRWKFLWMFCTKLKYTDKDIPHRPKPRLWEFVDKNLPLHRAPVIESFHLHYSSYSGAGKPEDIKRWIEIAVSRCVRELVIYHRSYGINILPNKFYTCKSLVYLKLSHVALIDVPSTGCCSLPSLKTLKLKYVSYANEDSLQQLLSACPVLEELLLHFEEDDTMTDFTVIVPSLKSLSIFIPICCPGLVGYVIDTPSLEYFKIEDQGELWHNAEIKNMPKLKEACICEVPDLESFIESITSVKRLTICPEQVIKSVIFYSFLECFIYFIYGSVFVQDRYGDGFVFSQLEHLQLCACRMNPLNLLSQLLNDSPNLRVLDISVIKVKFYIYIFFLLLLLV